MSEGKKKDKAWSQGKIKRPPSKRKRKAELSPGERQRMTQLLACLVLFAVVFVGRGMSSGYLAQLSSSIGTLIHHNTDFRSAFAKVGHAVSEGEPFVETFGILCTELFGEGEAEVTGEENLSELGKSVLAQPVEQVPLEVIGPDPLPQEPAKPAEEPPEEPKEPETVTPVMGVVSSDFGYREHPIDGEWKEHTGVDLVVDEGSSILAYADGEVDYVGESPAYGLYLQLKHGDGVTTFYAHCNAITVQKGQQVVAGEKIGEVGATGNVTGPHLHFEMKRDGIRVDPLDYIDTIQP